MEIILVWASEAVLNIVTTRVCPLWIATRVEIVVSTFFNARLTLQRVVISCSTMASYPVLGRNEVRRRCICRLRKINVGLGGHELRYENSMPLGGCFEQRVVDVGLQAWCRQDRVSLPCRS